MDIEKIKETPIADFLSRLGFHPVKKRGAVLWYHAPYRGDKSPSFKLDTRKEKWFDFGMGEGGDIFTLAGKLIPSNDFIRQAQYITETMRSALPLCFAKNLPMPEIKGTEYLKDLPDEEPQFSNVEVLPLGHYALRQYLTERAIPFEVASRYCKELHYDLRNKRYFAIGFPNDKGGYEVRNKFFKGCVAPKGTTFIKAGNEPGRECNVFEGFFDFLSAVTINQDAAEKDNLVLNSIIYLRKSTDLLSQYDQIHAYLDNDEAGRKAVQTLKDSLGEKVIDHTADYNGCKDLNEYLVNNQQNINHQNSTNNESNINNEECIEEISEDGLHGSRRVLHRCLR